MILGWMFSGQISKLAMSQVVFVNETSKYKTGPKAKATVDTSTDFTPTSRSTPDKSPEDVKPGGNVIAAKVDRCWFRVMSGSRPDEKGPVFAAINGDSVLIQRNHWVELPTHFLPVFKDALMSEVLIADDGKSSSVRDVPRFNFEVRSISEGQPRESNLPKGF